MIALAACAGCRDDFYNGRNELGIKRCWHAQDARIVTRYRIGTWTLPTQPGAYTKVRVPNCYRRQGVHYHAQLPDFVPLKNVIRARGSR